jgi:hypothetical protein
MLNKTNSRSSLGKNRLKVGVRVTVVRIAEALNPGKRIEGKLMGLFEVRFTEKAGSIVSVLEVVTAARLSVLESVRALLFELRIQIVRVESVVQETGLTERFHIAEFDGAPISRRRAAAIRSTVRKTLRARNGSEAAA